MAIRGPATREFVEYSEPVREALRMRAPIVALESALITHGLAYPKNEEVARGLEAAVTRGGAVPATIAVMGGKIRIGLEAADLASLAEPGTKVKVSRRDIAGALLKGACGGTTVAATMWLAAQQGIEVFSTGGIGGIHRESRNDVSADLTTLADTPVIVVSAGAKAILDLPATLEYLETAGVAVAGYQTSEFPAFYSRESGLPVSLQLDSPEEIAEYWIIQRRLGQSRALLIANPIPMDESIPASEITPIIAEASDEARSRGIHGQAVTPFLLSRVSELTNQKSIRANEALLLSNARLAAQIARALHKAAQSKEVLE